MGSAFFVVVTLLFWMAVIFCLGFCIVAIVCYNTIAKNRNSVVRAWADVITYERQKNNILPNIEEALKDYQEYERDLQIKITTLRTCINDIKVDEFNSKTLKEVEDQTLSLIKGIKIALENYPDLKTASLMQNFMQEIAKQQENIAAAIAIFNKNIEAFNNSIQMFPGYLVNSTWNHKTAIESFSDQKALYAFEYKLYL